MADPLIVDETRPLLAGTVYKTPSATTVAATSANADNNTDLEAVHHGSRHDDLAAFAGDLDNPRNWPAAFRWTIVLLLAFMAFTVTFTCISVVPFASHIVDELEGHPKDGGGGSGGVGSASVLLVTIWELGEAAGPLAIAPLSETISWGRAKVLTATSALFALATAMAALAPSTALFISARGLTGLAVATNVLNPAIVGDMFPPDQRGSAMSLVQLTPLMGGAIGPAIGGALADTWGWRSVLWLSTGLAVACNVLVWAAFRETYPPAILRARRQRLRKERQALQATKLAGTTSVPPSPSSSSLSSTNDVPTTSSPFTASPSPILSTSPASSGLRHIRDAVLRPAILLADSFVLAALAVYGAVLFSYFYVMSVSLPDILENRYGFSSAATGSSFLVFSTGAFCSVVVCNRYLDPIYRHLTNTRGRISPEDGVTRIGRPEFKLPLTTFCGLLLPLTVAAYGWSAELVLPLPCLLLAVSFMGASMLLSFIPLAAYVVDAFGLYAASAMTGVIVTRCLCGTFLPLAVAPLVAAFGYGWGFMVLAGVCLVVTPVPFAVYMYGEQWRQLSKYTRDV